jgi:hypothetical protein
MKPATVRQKKKYGQIRQMGARHQDRLANRLSVVILLQLQNFSHRIRPLESLLPLNGGIITFTSSVKYLGVI